MRCCMRASAFSGHASTPDTASHAARPPTAAWGLRKESLNRSGAIAAAAVGACSLGCGLRFGATLLAFFLASSKLTQYKQELKEGLDVNFKKGGQRDWKQVRPRRLLWHAQPCACSWRVRIRAFAGAQALPVMLSAASMAVLWAGAQPTCLQLPREHWRQRALRQQPAPCPKPGSV